MNYWLLNCEDAQKAGSLIHSVKVFEKDDRIVLISKGIVHGIFEANEKGFSEIIHVHGGLVARPLWYKTQLETPVKGTDNVYRLSKQEFEKIVLSGKEKKELVF